MLSRFYTFDEPLAFNVFGLYGNLLRFHYGRSKIWFFTETQQNETKYSLSSDEPWPSASLVSLACRKTNFYVKSKHNTHVKLYRK